MPIDRPHAIADGKTRRRIERDLDRTALGHSGPDLLGLKHAVAHGFVRRTGGSAACQLLGRDQAALDHSFSEPASQFS